MGIILKLDDMIVTNDTYTVNGISDTSFNLVKFNVLNGESCSKLEQFIVIEPSDNPDDIRINQVMEQVC